MQLRNYAIIMGNEVKGVQTGKLLTIAMVCIEIPQYGTKHFFECFLLQPEIVIWDFLLLN